MSARARLALLVSVLLLWGAPVLAQAPSRVDLQIQDVGSVSAPHLAPQQSPGIRRTDLQRHDLGDRGRGVVQVRVDFDPGVAFGNHRHPGEEIVYDFPAQFDHSQDPSRRALRF